jgi:YjbE family integral membrane protein
MEFTDAAFWTALIKIIGIDIVLAGDNAVVIALAARRLPAQQQKMAIFLGCAAAVVIRVVLTLVAASLLTTPYLRIIGGALLLWIGVKLLTQNEGEAHVSEANNLGEAVKTIVIADVVMSVDNIIGVAGAAGDSKLLLALGLAISIPLVIFASALILKIMERFPIVITLGAALLGYVAGEMLVTDPVTKDWVLANAAWLKYGLPIFGAVAVVAVGKWIASRRPASAEATSNSASG